MKKRIHIAVGSTAAISILQYTYADRFLETVLNSVNITIDEVVYVCVEVLL